MRRGASKDAQRGGGFEGGPWAPKGGGAEGRGGQRQLWVDTHVGPPTVPSHPLTPSPMWLVKDMAKLSAMSKGDEDLRTARLTGALPCPWLPPLMPPSDEAALPPPPRPAARFSAEGSSPSASVSAHGGRLLPPADSHASSGGGGHGHGRAPHRCACMQARLQCCLRSACASTLQTRPARAAAAAAAGGPTPAHRARQLGKAHAGRHFKHFIPSPPDRQATTTTAARPSTPCPLAPCPRHTSRGGKRPARLPPSGPPPSAARAPRLAPPPPPFPRASSRCRRLTKEQLVLCHLVLLVNDLQAERRPRRLAQRPRGGVGAAADVQPDRPAGRRAPGAGGGAGGRAGEGDAVRELAGGAGPCKKCGVRCSESREGRRWVGADHPQWRCPARGQRGSDLVSSAVHHHPLHSHTHPVPCHGPPTPF